MKKCRNCGADLPEGASFCPHCAQSQIERQEVKPPRLWRKKALIAALCALVLVTAALAVFLPHRPKTYEGGASVTYTDQDGTYELFVGTSLNNIEDKQPEEKRTLSLSVDETSYLPAMLGVYRNGTPVDPEAFLAKVERCILEAFPNENGALDIAEPRYNEMFSAAVLETDVVFTGASGTNELVWTLTMKNGDTIRLKHTFEVLPLVHAAFTAEDTPLNTIEDLKALLDRIDDEVPADTVADIYLPPVTYTGDLHISSRAVNLYGCCDGSGRTVIEGSLTVSTHAPDKVVLHDLDFVGNGGNGLTATASTVIENCSFTGYDIGAAVQAVSQAHTGGSSPPPSDGVTASSAGSTCFPHFSGKAPSAPQTVQSAFMSSDLQAVSQMHVGAASPPSSAKAAVGSVESTMTNTSRMLSSRFFIAVPFLSVLCVSRTPRERVVSVIPGWYMHHQYNIQLG